MGGMNNPIIKFDVALAAPLREIAALATQAEALGVDALWTSEAAHNPFLPLTLAAARTQRIALGTSIAVAFPRSPMVTAQLAWDLAAQSEGRFMLGLGTQVKAHIVRRFATAWDSPGPRLRDYILAMRAIWDCWQNNTPLHYDGEFYKLNLMTPFFSPGRITHPAIPVYIAGVNPYLCKLAGELCQGFHVHPFHTPRYLREIVLPNIEKGAAEHGRTRADIQTACAIFVVTGGDDADLEASKNAIKAQIAFYASTPSYEVVLQVHGWEALGQQCNALSKQGRWLEMADLVSDEVLNEIAVVAPHDQLAAKVRERYAGLLDRIAYYFPFDANSTPELWSDAVRVLGAKQEST